MHAFAFPSLTLMHAIRAVVMHGAARLRSRRMCERPVRWSLRVEIAADGDFQPLLRKLRGEEGMDDLAQHAGGSGLALDGWKKAQAGYEVPKGKPMLRGKGGRGA